MTYPVTVRTTPTRYPDRVSYDRDTAHAILDEAYVGHLGLSTPDGPLVLPMMFARLDDTLYLHGSTGSHAMLAAGEDGIPVCLTVTLLDGLVYARSHFHHSANYRCVVVRGMAEVVRDDGERRAAMAALIDKVGSNRSAHTRPPATKELAATAILRLPLVEVSVKVRAGGVADDTADLQTPAWAGVIPLKLMPGLPEPADSVRVPLPDYLRLDRGPWYQPARMAGRLVSLEPLDASHTDDLFAALDHEDVWRHLPRRRPTTVGDYRQIVQAGLAAMYRGERVIWVQRSTVTGEVIGTTAYYDIDPANRWLAIGWTQLGRSWWGTGVNAQAKLLLLSRAFEELGAVRVAWHTDVRNERSRAAITALGAVPEGMLRYHKRRTDGSWRDTMLYSMTCDEWPAAKERLVQRYSAASP